MADDVEQTRPNPDYSAPDWFLQSLVDMANKTGVEYGITLQVSGFLVSGTLVGGRKYFEGFADEFAGAIADEADAQAAREGFARFGSVYDVEEGDNPSDKPPPSFIHLRGARFFHPGGTAVPTNNGVWWRGRLSDVAGFVLGSLS